MMTTEYVLTGFILASVLTLTGCGYNPTKDAMELCLSEAETGRQVSVSASSGRTDRVTCSLGEAVNIPAS